MVVPPNHPFLIGFSFINHPFWGTAIFGNHHIPFPWDAMTFPGKPCNFAGSFASPRTQNPPVFQRSALCGCLSKWGELSCEAQVGVGVMFCGCSKWWELGLMVFAIDRLDVDKYVCMYIFI